MLDNADLEAAVRRGVITEEMANRLRSLSAQRRGVPAADEERFGLVGGFSDVMTALGLVLLLPPVLVMLFLVSPLASFLLVPVAWGLAEYFTRKRRLTLTSFVLFGLFVLAVAMGCMAVGLMMAAVDPASAKLPATPVRLPPISGLVTAAGLMWACIAWWYRFRLPIAVAAAAMAGANVAVHVLRMLFPAMPAAGVSFLLLLIGIIFLLAALRWDMSDVRRETVRAEIAFWLHAMAGFQLAGASFRLIFGVAGNPQGWDRLYVFTIQDPTPAGIGIALILLFGFTLLALAIDRRSLLLSGIAFLLPALVRTQPLLAWPMAMLFGLILLVLSAGWSPLRARILQRLPLVVRAQLPRTELDVFHRRPVQ